MVFISGFARGGTSWLRDCVAFHPDIGKIPGEMLAFRDLDKRRDIEALIEGEIAKNDLSSPYFVNKAPANSPHIAKACALFPEAKFLFIIRDPRDVLVSHQRGNKGWMRGTNSTIDGCMMKIRAYYEGFEQAKDCKNLLLVTYEQLHQDFHATMRLVYQFIGVTCDDEFLDGCFKKNNFVAAAGRRQEDRDDARRKGVVGDWANHLSAKEVGWYQQDPYWSTFLRRHGYRQEPITFESILAAMKTSAVHCLAESEILDGKLRADAVNALLLHDVDELRKQDTRESVLATAQIEADHGMFGVFNFLPLDDVRYKGVKPNEIAKLIDGLRSRNPRIGIGLHLNAAERFFPAKMADVGNDHPDVAKAIRYLHQQVDDYEKIGIRFRFATAHGYGRGKKRPNNRDCGIFTEELAKRGIALWDTVLRSAIDGSASHVAVFHDVGEPLAIKRMPHAGRVDDPESYRRFPVGGLVRFLSHPGNYDIRRPLTLGLRFNQEKPKCKALQASEDD
jgi:hypothetical protein